MTCKTYCNMFSNMRIENKPGSVKAAARVIGDKWTPLLIHALAHGPLRFCELQKAAGGINPRTLSARLVSLEKRNIIEKNMQPTIPPYAQYALSKKGTDLVPILQCMAMWGETYHDDRL